jgi:hypothetical protein
MIKNNIIFDSAAEGRCGQLGAKQQRRAPPQGGISPPTGSYRIIVKKLI